MGNCQAAEAAAIVVQNPGSGKVEIMYWSVSAKEVMSSNPGYYVALVSQRPGQQPNNNSIDTSSQPIQNQLKLLRPDDMLHIGHVYRLISFEDVIKEFTAKKSVKLGKLLKGSGGGLGVEKKKNLGASCGANLENSQMGRDNQQVGRSSRGVGRHHCGGGWKPALQSIAELQ